MLETINRYIWGSGMLVLLLGTGLLVSIRTGFFQIFGIRTILRHTIGRLSGSEQGRAQWKTCSAALAAAMGTGNIVGVAAALAVGGAGAIFWMWISAFLGMMLTYAENVLAMRFCHVTEDGRQVVGTLAYLQSGLHMKGLAVLYAVFCVMASLGMGNMTQSSAAANALEHACHIPSHWTGLILTILLFCTVLGGMQSIGSVTQVLMPLLSSVYLLASLLVLWQNRQQLPAALQTIVSAAWHPEAAGGGTLGTVIAVGLRHGVFSNEAGLGSSAMIHSHTTDEVPCQQGMWSMVEVFIDTIVCCTLTALVLLVTGTAELGGVQAVTAAFSGVFGGLAEPILSVIIALFALATLLGWCCCGEQAAAYLGGKTGIKVYRWVYCLAAGIGAVAELSTIWTLSDIANGLMAIPNLLGILCLLRYVKRPENISKS